MAPTLEELAASFPRFPAVGLELVFRSPSSDILGGIRRIPRTLGNTLPTLDGVDSHAPWQLLPQFPTRVSQAKDFRSFDRFSKA